MYQAWVSAMEEMTKNGHTDSPKRILTLCINLVSTSVRGHQILEEIRLLRVDIGVIDYIVGINFYEKSNGTIQAEKPNQISTILC